MKLTPPPALASDPAAIRGARKDLERALSKLAEMEEQLGGCSETDG